jgi:hypothetical protein
MGNMVVTKEWLAAKFETIFSHLDERQRRLCTDFARVYLVARLVGRISAAC